MGGDFLKSFDEYLPVMGADETLFVLLINSDLERIKEVKSEIETLGSLNLYLCSSGNEAIESTQTQKFDAIVSDYDLPDMDGITLHHNLQVREITIPFILFSLSDSSNLFKNNNSLGLTENGKKTFTELSHKIRQSVELYRTKNRLALYSQHLEELVEERTRQLKEAQRFAVIGELSTMIGHDMRNPLQVITNLNYIYSKKVKSMNDGEEAVLLKYGISNIFDRINSETQYLNKIVSDLQDYAREITINGEIIFYNKFVEDILNGFTIPETILVNLDIPVGLSGYGDPTLLRRVLVNLVTNAFQAMEKGGILDIEIKELDDLIIWNISDTGTGVKETVRKKIFQPLFTTKSKGTGLGLPVCRRLVQAHGGSINLKESSPDGSIFEVILPQKRPDIDNFGVL